MFFTEHLNIIFDSLESKRISLHRTTDVYCRCLFLDICNIIDFVYSWKIQIVDDKEAVRHRYSRYVLGLAFPIHR